MNELETLGLKAMIKEAIEEKFGELEERISNLEVAAGEEDLGEEPEEDNEEELEFDEEANERDILKEKVEEGTRVDKETMKKIDYQKSNLSQKPKKKEGEDEDFEMETE